MVKITQLTKKDIDAILDLEAHSAPPLPTYFPYDRKELENNIFSNKENKAFGAFDGTKLVGWSAYMLNNTSTKKGSYEMCSLVVDKSYRRQGIGLELFKIRLNDLLKKGNVTEIYATNYPKNLPILLLYLTNGFVIYDYKKNVYGDGGDRLYLKYDKLN